MLARLLSPARDLLLGLGADMTQRSRRKHSEILFHYVYFNIMSRKQILGSNISCRVLSRFSSSFIREIVSHPQSPHRKRESVRQKGPVRQAWYPSLRIPPASHHINTEQHHLWSQRKPRKLFRVQKLRLEDLRLRKSLNFRGGVTAL